jgi:hypothetical protein
VPASTVSGTTTSAEMEVRDKRFLKHLKSVEQSVSAEIMVEPSERLVTIYGNIRKRRESFQTSTTAYEGVTDRYEPTPDTILIKVIPVFRSTYGAGDTV